MKTEQRAEEWAVSSDGENYWGGVYDSKERAIAECLVLGGGYVGRCVPPPQPEDLWEAADWLEHVSCQDEYSGEWAEGWAGHVTQEMRTELEAEVRPVLAAWLARHGLNPTFYTITDAEKVEETEE